MSGKILDFLIIIQARLESTRLPNKVMQMIGDKTMLRRVWDAAKKAESILHTYAYTCKVIVAWPERYPDVDQSNVLERFKRISNEFPSKEIVRLTSDCPLLTANDICDIVISYRPTLYTSNHCDGHDVQIFSREYLFDSRYTHREHVIADFDTKPTGLSVNTLEDLENVRYLLK